MIDRATIRSTLIELLEADTGEKYSTRADDANLREGLGLDSVDALELALALQKRYDIRIASDSKDARQHFTTVASLAAFVQAQRDACAN